MAQQTTPTDHRDFQVSASTTAPATALAPAPVVSPNPAFAAAVPNQDGTPALEAPKTRAANEQIDSTGLSHIRVAQELGVATLTNEQYEEALEAQPERPQDVDTGGLVKQHNIAETEGFDPDIFNTWSCSDQVPKELG